MAHQAVEVEDGLSLPASNALRIEVPMSNPFSTKFTSEKGGRVLWTRNVTSCRVIVTLDQQNGNRTMTHLGGGNASPDFYTALATEISEHTTIIIANGDDVRREAFDFDEAIIKREILDAMNRIKKPIDKLEWKPFFLTLEREMELAKAVGLKRASFVIQPDGRYGRARGDLPGPGM